MTEPETIEAEVAEIMLPAVREQHAVNLFGDASPVTVIERATEAANALAAVIESKKLYAQIGPKKHVVVEGWTLLGSMLGVFPVVEWTRPLEDGWEARVVARTRNGDEVGAAEAMCTRRENAWKSRDEYALRSMAQTRAVSKALRHPLGFVMTLAGYEATPEGEMPTDSGASMGAGSGAPEVRIEGPDPLPLPRNWAMITKYVSEYDEFTHDTFFQFAASARRLLYPGSVDTKDLSKEEKAELLKVAAGAALVLCNSVPAQGFPPPTVDEIRAAWASVLEGQELALPEPEA
jgi:hypothetical protein